MAERVAEFQKLGYNAEKALDAARDEERQQREAEAEEKRQQREADAEAEEKRQKRILMVMQDTSLTTSQREVALAALTGLQDVFSRGRGSHLHPTYFVISNGFCFVFLVCSFQQLCSPFWTLRICVGQLGLQSKRCPFPTEPRLFLSRLTVYTVSESSTRAGLC